VVAAGGMKSVRVRPFVASDLPRVEEMCRGVYGGTDYMPRMAMHYAGKPGTCVLVLEEEEAEGEGGEGASSGGEAGEGVADRGNTGGVGVGTSYLAGLGGMSRRRADVGGGGAVAWMFGLRTCETRRGRGLARQMLRALEKEADGCTHCMTATVRENATMVRMLGQFGYEEEDEVVVWPVWTKFHEASETLAKQVEGERMAYLDCLATADPLASEALRLGTGCREDCEWVQCEGPDEFVNACAEVRLGDAGGKGRAPLWFPSEYNAYPAACEDSEAWVRDGQCWVLRSGGKPVCVARVYRSMEMRDRACLAALVTDATALSSAVAHASQIFGTAHPFACFLAGPGARPGRGPFSDTPGLHESFNVYLKSMA